MRFTRRFRAAAGVAVVLGGLAAVTGKAVLLGGSLLLGSWLAGGAYAFALSARQATDALELDVSVTPATVRAGGETSVTVAGSWAADSADLPVSVDCRLPAAGELLDGEPTFTVTPETERDATTLLLAVPVAGRFEVGPCRLTVGDPSGLFETTVTAAISADLAVRPRRPHDVHVGEAGRRVATTYGEHETGRGGAGLEPAELRQYVPGDPTSRIDWNATARLGDPYVREFEAQVDRETLLVVDHRATMGAGRAGERKLDYARELALAVVDSADALADPLGLMTVGDGGTTAQQDPGATDVHYRHVRTRLADLVPTDGSGSRSDPLDPGRARAVAARLADDDSPFAGAVGPLLADGEAYVRRAREDPLLDAVGTALARRSRTDLAVVVTDDAGRTELRETARLLRRQGVRVVFYLLPGPLYEPGGLADLDEAYAAYVGFEEFRRELAGITGVTAFEVAPEDRLGAVLSAGRGRPDREVSAG